MPDVNRIDFDEPERPEGETERRARQIPKLPKFNVTAEDIKDADRRAQACVNLKLAGASWQEIARELSYASAKSAQQAYVSALANMYPVEDWETLRQTEALRAEQQLNRSVMMASAEYLVDSETGERMPNRDRLRWHEQAGKDLALHAMITGAKAPTRVEVSASVQELNQMVDAIIASSGGENEVEADVFELDQLPAASEEVAD